MFLICSCLVVPRAAGQEKSGFPVLKGPYLGQIPPDTIPVPFAPGILNPDGDRMHGFPSFSPDGREVCWSLLRIKERRPVGLLMTMKEEGGVWTSPRILPFSGLYLEQAGCFSPDGRRLLFQSRRPGGSGSLDIWYVERTDTGWSAPVSPGSPPNSDKLESQPSMTREGHLYLIRSMEGVGFNRGIYRSEWNGSEYEAPEPLDDRVNTPSIDTYPFVTPDEQILVFSSSRPAAKEEDLKLVVCFRTDGGGWTEPADLSAALGLEGPARFPCITPDGRYLFFLYKGEIFWVDATVINRLRP
jgi:hypothetical protein